MDRRSFLRRATGAVIGTLAALTVGRDSSATTDRPTTPTTTTTRRAVRRDDDRLFRITPTRALSRRAEWVEAAERGDYIDWDVLDDLLEDEQESAAITCTVCGWRSPCAGNTWLLLRDASAHSLEHAGYTGWHREAPKFAATLRGFVREVRCSAGHLLARNASTGVLHCERCRQRVFVRGTDVVRGKPRRV